MRIKEMIAQGYACDFCAEWNNPCRLRATTRHQVLTGLEPYVRQPEHQLNRSSAGSCVERGGARKAAGGTDCLAYAHVSQ